VIARATGSRQPRRITTRLCIGAIVPTLAELTEKNSQMIVVGRRGRGGVRRALLGSVSSAVVRAAQCPVAVVHRHVSPVQRSGAPIVVGVDGSPASESAMAIAFDEATRRACDIVAVNSFDHAAVSEVAEPLVPSLTDWQARYPDVEVHGMIARDHPVDVILDQARRAQLVVIGSRGRGLFSRDSVGSVSAAVMQACRVPVIVAPAPQSSAQRIHRRSTR
jgi:nucleotide-binding universal stress UspA family protein